MSRFISDNKYWINSNSGDYIMKSISGKITLELIERSYYDINGKYNHIPSKSIDISEVEFNNIKGFVTIKPKRLVNTLYRYKRYNKMKYKYKPTLKGGIYGKPQRFNLPDKSDIRDSVISSIINI